MLRSKLLLTDHFLFVNKHFILACSLETLKEDYLASEHGWMSNLQKQAKSHPVNIEDATRSNLDPHQEYPQYETLFHCQWPAEHRSE